MFFKLVDINGDDVVGGGLVDLESWITYDQYGGQHVASILNQSWVDRNDVVALYCLDINGQEYFSLEPEATRKFLRELIALSNEYNPFNTGT